MARTRAHQSLNRLVQLDDIKSAERKYRKNRFRLRTAFLVLSGFCVLFAVVAAMTPTLAPRIEEKFAKTQSTIPDSMMTESFVPFSVLVALGVGLVVAFIVYRLGNRAGFFVFGALAGLGLITVVAAMALDIQPLGETPLKDMTWVQSTYSMLLAHGLILPLAAFSGWYASLVLYKNRV